MIQTLSVFHLNTIVSDLEWKIFFLKQYKTKKGMPVCESDIQLISTRVSMQSMESCHSDHTAGNLGKTLYKVSEHFYWLNWCLLDRWQLFWHVLGKRLAST